MFSKCDTGELRRFAFAASIIANRPIPSAKQIARSTAPSGSRSRKPLSGVYTAASWRATTSVATPSITGFDRSPIVRSESTWSGSPAPGRPAAGRGS